jgi:hypothetical protein
MITFKDFVILNEAARADINVHLEHIEDELFNKGKVGADSALNYLYDMGQMLEGHSKNSVKLSVKWDGAPALFCGNLPGTNKFFVSTKGLFAKDAKICHTSADVKKYYGDKPGLAEKLNLALQYLPQLGITDVIQGDFLFDKKALKNETIDNKAYVTFKPNTITYAVPAESALAKRITSAKIGIIFHTLYTGDSIDTLKANFNVSKDFNDSTDVYYDDATIKDYSGFANFTQAESTQYNQMLAVSKKLLSQIHTNTWTVFSQPNMSMLVKTFINSQIRGGVLVGETDKFITSFFLWFENKMNGEIAKLKNQSAESPAVQSRISSIEQFKSVISKHTPQFKLILNLYKNIYDMKIQTLNKLRNIMQGTGAQTFLKTENGFEVTAPEGLVAIDHLGGAVKLVDRLTFSRANFTGEKTFN